MPTIDRALGWLLAVNGMLHGVGSWLGYRTAPETLLWSLAGVLAAMLVAAVNLLRVNRPADTQLAAVSLAGSVLWAAVAIGFGVVLGNLIDPRAMVHALTALALAALSARTLVRARTPVAAR